ncbi:alpha/beta hydrolase fold domain-containing protein [Paraburkholderia solisilvae]|uniref:Carboxylesterase NlhH n=1 Tax=Paraburkholderia solisilvae TaxID=624376 RepID=A0A6J5DMU9_9BURK|nr:alpha/beta hydrolase [Paraburkholderia solisilvae]CAB3754847.1 Carboxylesterase NlhH [Paraburkholderia solisilvae]
MRKDDWDCGDEACNLPDDILASAQALIDPEIRQWLEAVDPPDHVNLTVEQARAPDLHVEERNVPYGPDGASMRIVLVRPVAVGRLPIFYYVHGGGYMYGTPETALRASCEFARHCGCVVALPTYRLAPQTRFPGAVEDLERALGWVLDSHAELNIDPTRLAVGGVSAGGGHAAALVLRLRDRGPSIGFQLLSMPMLDDRTGASRDPGAIFGQNIWRREQNRTAWEALLGCRPGGEMVDPDSVPARVASVKGLPPTFVGVGQLDLFARENVEFAMRLMVAGIPTELCVMSGAVHGFDSFVPDAVVSIAYARTQQRALSAAFERMK